MPRLGHRADETYGFQWLPKETEANNQVSEAPAAFSPELVVVRDLPRHDPMEIRVAFSVPERQRPAPEITFIATPMRSAPALGAAELRNAMSEFGWLLNAVMKERDPDTVRKGDKCAIVACDEGTATPFALEGCLGVIA